jgi:four helix bundle protein
MATFRFIKFPVYIEARKYYKEILAISNKIKLNHSLKDQINRASLSAVLNIAEGSAKKSDKEFARFLEISIASMNEVVACLDIMLSIGTIEKDIYCSLVSKAEIIVKQLGGFIKKLNSTS